MIDVLGIIPARGGSKGITRKNLVELRGRPLLEYTIDAALGATLLKRVVLSTEDEEIAQVGRHAGADVPFLRPKELAQDDTPTLPVVQHALRTLAAREQTFDAAMILQPTNPLRQPSDIAQQSHRARE